jgi:hypothetical protein
MTIDSNTPNEPATMPPSSPGDETWSTDGPPKGVRIRLPIGIAAIAVAALVGIWGGAQLKGDNASATVAAGGRGANGAFPGGGRGAGANGQGGGATAGTVQSVNGNTITITDPQGATKTITLESNTTVTKSAAGSASDITTGETIVVRGSTNSDGSTTAQSVSIGSGGGGFPGGPPPDTASSGN